MAAPQVKASSCEGPYAFSYELVEVRLVDGMGDPTGQALWTEGAQLQPDPDGRAKFIIFTDTTPEGEYLLLQETDP